MLTYQSVLAYGGGGRRHDFAERGAAVRGRLLDINRGL